MIGSIFNTIAKVFGSKSERDLKTILPLVKEINAHYEQLRSLSNDELRGKTIEFKAAIAEYLKGVDAEIAEVKQQAESTDIDLHAKEELFRELDKLKKKRDEELEKVLQDILFCFPYYII